MVTVPSKGTGSPRVGTLVSPEHPAPQRMTTVRHAHRFMIVFFSQVMASADPCAQAIMSCGQMSDTGTSSGVGFIDLRGDPNRFRGPAKAARTHTPAVGVKSL